MKSYRRRVLYFLTAMVLMIHSLGTCKTIFAEEGSSTSTAGKPFDKLDDYVLELGSSTSGLKIYQEYSPFVPTLTYNGQTIDGYSILFGLSKKKEAATSTAYALAYCVDLPVDANDGMDYQRLNLTDSTYAAAHADKLRGIVMGSYPKMTLEQLRTASGIAELTTAEAITATQLAIWKTAHGDNVQITDFLKSITNSYSNSGTKNGFQTEYDAYNNGDATYQANVKARIEKLYYYLMDLPEKQATNGSKVISRAAFTDATAAPVLNSNGDGIYNVTVTATVDIPTGCDVTITASMADGKYYKTNTLTEGENTITLTIENVPEEYAKGSVTLSIDGTQNVSEDVFLLDAKGIRGASQSLIAPLSGSFPVHAETKAGPDRVLEIYKKNANNGAPLENISFEVYYVGSQSEVNQKIIAGDIGTNTGNNGIVPTQNDINKYAVKGNLVGTITTDANGYGKLVFDTEDTDDAVYLVKELPNELVKDWDKVVFFVSIPDYAHVDTNKNPAYTVTAKPKNTIKEEDIEIEKDVTNIDNEHDTYDVGKNHTWIIQSSVPDGIATGKKYEISDTLDSRLTLVSVDKVTLAKDSGTFGNSEDTTYTKDPDETPMNAEGTAQGTAVLVKDVDYKVVIGKTSNQDTFTMSLTTTGMKKVADLVGDTKSGWEIRTYFTAYINTSALVGEEIPNKATVDYTNALMQDFSKESDIPEVHMGGIQLLKVDANVTDGTTGNLKPLAGAEFKLYRAATETEKADTAIKKETLVVNGTTHKNMVAVSFYPNTEMTGDKVDTLTTSADGKGYMYGLAYGDYYLVETKAPAGYSKLFEAVEVKVTAISHQDANKVTVKNAQGMDIPSTGGIGTGVFYIGGTFLMASAATLLVLKKRNCL